PADLRAPAVKEDADPEQQRQEGEAEGPLAPKGPVAAVHDDLVEEEVRAAREHAEAEEEDRETPGGAADVAQVVHARSITPRRSPHRRAGARSLHARGEATY